MMKKGWKRALLAGLVCAIGGMGLVGSIFPLLLVRLFEEIPILALQGVRDSGGTIALLWGISGGIVGWYGGERIALVLMSFCGLLSGLYLGMVVYEVLPDSRILNWGLGIGALYGIPGGLIMGRVFLEE